MPARAPSARQVAQSPRASQPHSRTSRAARGQLPQLLKRCQPEPEFSLGSAALFGV